MSQQNKRSRLGYLMQKHLQDEDPWWEETIDRVIDLVDSQDLPSRYDFSRCDHYANALDITKVTIYLRKMELKDQSENLPVKEPEVSRVIDLEDLIAGIDDEDERKNG